MTYFLPDNFDVLQQAEETIRTESLKAIGGSEDLPKHAALIEHTMTQFRYFYLEHQASSKDVKTVQLLGVRLFNATASAWKLLLSGYHQNSLLQQRDLLETVFLLDYFHTDHKLIAEWQHSTDKTRREKFSPATVRRALDERDGFTTGKRANAYKMFCELGAHPTYLAFHLLTDKPGGEVRTGPFLDLGLLRAGVEELARLLAQAGAVYINLFPKVPSDFEAHLQFREIQGKWAEQFLGRPFDHNQMDELRRLANEAHRKSEHDFH